MRSTDEIARLLREAEAAVDAAEISEDLRPGGFQAALDELRAATRSGGRLKSSDEDDTGAQINSHPRSDSPLATLSARLNIEMDVVREIYEVGSAGDDIRLIVGPAMLPDASRRAAAMRDVAILVAVGRQATQLEEYTSFRIIRSECDELGVLDGPNFAAEIGKLGFRTRGSHSSREVKANRGHFERAVELIHEMVESSK